MIKICNRIIEYSFYALFLITPLVFTSATSELFEFNKMWFVFGLSIIIGASWFSKMILQRRILLCRTPLDIPILLFLVSQIFSTFFSLDTHVSIWGYYSRFNGGLLSILSYIFLYYAFISNLNSIFFVKRLLKISLISGLIVALWGLPSHFGYDPSCFLFRGTLDVSCWTDAFQPKVRIFSTLGQPNWLAAYLSILIPISIAFLLKNSNIEYRNSKQYQNQNDKNSKRFEHSSLKNWDLFERLTFFRVSNFGFWIYLLLPALFFIALLYTTSRSGFLGLVSGLFILFLGIMILSFKTKNFNKKYFLTPFIILLIISLFMGTPFTKKVFEYNSKNLSIQIPKKQENKPQGPALEVGGTDSGKIRKIVWQGAVDIWKNSPVFGSGVETFAFAYYKFRPSSHNLVSEWDYLYNKAHNEYLNYLATTGLFGLGSYLSIIGLFFFLTLKQFKTFPCHPEFISGSKEMPKQVRHDNNKNFELLTLNFALIAAYISILVSNFFGFSVVIVNLYLFMIPAFVFVLMNMIEPKNSVVEQPVHRSFNEVRLSNGSFELSAFQWLSITLLLLIAGFLLLNLMRFWVADTNYGLGNNLDKAGVPTQGYSYLVKAVTLRSDEPVFKDQLSINNALLAVAAAGQNNATASAQFLEQAIKISDLVVLENPNNIVFWKTRARVFYNLSQIDNKYLFLAKDALKKANELAPTDAKIMYNLAVLYGQTQDLKTGTNLLIKTIKLKPDYKDAYYALGLFYREQAVDKNGKIKNSALQNKANETMNYILSHFTSNDTVKQTLKSWGEL